MDKSNHIFIHKFLKAIADSMINVFIPLYILKITNDLKLALGFLAMRCVFGALLILGLKKLLQKYGVICIILHCLPVIATQALLNFCVINWWIVFACAMLMALSQTLYSVPLNLLFALGDKNSNVTKFQIATNVGKLFFMLLSALLLSRIANSFLYLSIVSSVIYLSSNIPLGFGYRLLKLKSRQSWRKRKEGNKPKLPVWFHIYHLCFGSFQIVIEHIVPLFLFVNDLSFEAVALVIALVEMCKIGANYLAKLLINKKQQLTSCIISFCIFVSCVICLLVIKVPVVLYILTCCISVAFPFTFVPLFKIFCETTRKQGNTVHEMTMRDVYIFSSRPIIYVQYFIFSSMLPCFILGLGCAGLMFASQYKILQNNKNTKKQFSTSTNTPENKPISEKSEQEINNV